jgi:hypothetical protein
MASLGLNLAEMVAFLRQAQFGVSQATSDAVSRDYRLPALVLALAGLARAGVYCYERVSRVRQANAMIREKAKIIERVMEHVESLTETVAKDDLNAAVELLGVVKDIEQGRNDLARVFQEKDSDTTPR